jgi:hypothetical protein
MSYALLTAHCVSCGVFFTSNPKYVPSIRVKGEREPICRSCADRWNEIHRTSKGLDPQPLHPDAYEPIAGEEL